MVKNMSSGSNIKHNNVRTQRMIIVKNNLEGIDNQLIQSEFGYT